MKKTIVFFLLFTIYCSLCRVSAQSRTIDSLLRIVNPENGQVYADTMKVNVYNKLCGEYDNRSDFENGLKYGNMGLELAKKIGFRKGEAKCYTNLGNILDDQSDYSKAIDYYMKSIKIGTEINDTYGTAVAYNDMGLIYMYQSDYPKALDCYLKSLNLNEVRKDKKGMSTNFNNIGIIYMNQNDYKKALEYGLKSLKTDEDLGDKKGVADSYSNIGIIYERQKEYEQALNYFLKSKKIREQLGLREALANSYSNIADIYTNIFITDTAGAGLTTSDNEHIAHSHLLDSSLALENKALAVNKEIGNKYIVTYIMLGIGNVYFNQKKYKEALEYYKKDYVLADSLGALNEETNIAKALSGCYFKMHDYEKALEWYQKFVQIGDSVFNGAKNKEITNKTLKFEFDKKAIADSVKTDEEKKVISAELKQEQTKSYALYGGLALLLAFAGLMYNRFKITHKQKNIIELKEKETEKQKNVVEEKNKQITKSRQHYLKFKLPDTYNQLAAAGIMQDYSMGFAETPGFRAGTCKPFYFYDLRNERSTLFKVFPITCMEASFLYYSKRKPAESLDIILALINEVKKVDGTFISIWHNNTVSDDGIFKEWKWVHNEMIKRVLEIS